MIYIEMANGSVLNWWTGYKNPVPATDVNLVVEVQADGDELSYVLRDNEPGFRYGRVVRFFGDDAKFIVANSIGY